MLGSSWKNSYLEKYLQTNFFCWKTIRDLQVQLLCILIARTVLAKITLHGTTMRHLLSLCRSVDPVLIILQQLYQTYQNALQVMIKEKVQNAMCCWLIIITVPTYTYLYCG